MTTQPRKKHASEISISTWLPQDLALELDNFLTEQAAGRIGVRPSRQAFILAAIRAQLAHARAEQAVRS